MWNTTLERKRTNLHILLTYESILGNSTWGSAAVSSIQLYQTETTSSTISKLCPLRVLVSRLFNTCIFNRPTVIANVRAAVAGYRCRYTKGARYVHLNNGQTTIYTA